MTTTTKHQIVAEWDAEQRRYVVDPAKADCDVAGTVASGWWSEDGNDWLDFGGGDVAGDFDKVTIQFAGGPQRFHQEAKKHT